MQDKHSHIWLQASFVLRAKQETINNKMFWANLAWASSGSFDWLLLMQDFMLLRLCFVPSFANVGCFGKENCSENNELAKKSNNI